MKRVISFVLMYMMLLVIAACGASQPLMTTNPGVEYTASPSESEPAVVPTYEETEVTLTDENVKDMQEYLSTCAYMHFMQDMENGVTGQAVYSWTNYSISVNIAQKLHSITMRYIESNGMSREGVGYKLFTDGKDVLVSENGVWVEADGKYEMIAWDLSKFENDWDIFMYLMHDIELPVGSVGTAAGGYWTFSYTEKATNSLVTGIEYDELLDADYEFIFHILDGHVVPSVVSVNVGYRVGENTYYVSSKIQINSVGNTELIMPELGSES